MSSSYIPKYPAGLTASLIQDEQQTPVNADGIPLDTSRGFGQDANALILELKEVQKDLRHVFQSGIQPNLATFLQESHTAIGRLEAKGGETFPGSPEDGELFYRRDRSTLYRYNRTSGEWEATANIVISGLTIDNFVTISGIQTIIGHKTLRSGLTSHDKVLLVSGLPTDPFAAAHKLYVDTLVTLSGTGLNLILQEDDVTKGSNTNTINFEGGVDVINDGGGKITVIISGLGGGGSTSITVQEDDVTEATGISILNFEKVLDVTADGGGKVTIDVDDASLNNNFVHKSGVETLLGQKRFREDVVVDDYLRGVVLRDNQATPHFWRAHTSGLGGLVFTDVGTTYP